MTYFEQGDSSVASTKHENIDRQSYSHSLSNPDNLKLLQKISQPSDHNQASNPHVGKMLNDFSISFSSDEKIAEQMAQRTKKLQPLDQDGNHKPYENQKLIPNYGTQNEAQILARNESKTATDASHYIPAKQTHEIPPPAKTSSGQCEVVWATYYNPTGNRTADGHKYSSSQTGHLMGVAVDRDEPILNAHMGDMLKITDISSGHSTHTIVHDKGAFAHLDTSDNGAHIRGVDMTKYLANEFGIGPGKHTPRAKLVEVCTE